MKEHSIWVEKYRPKQLEDYIGNENLKLFIKQCLESQNIPHLLLYSSPGTGKTTLSKILIKNIKCGYLYINASDERGIDTIRDKVQRFAQAASFEPVKIVILDEADYLTTQAQASLRNIIETYSLNTRFILTCNYVERIIEPLQSRCQTFKVIPPSKQEVAEYVVGILEKENIKYELENLVPIIKRCYPDIRKIINTCQSLIKDGELKLDGSLIVDNSYLPKILEELKGKPNWKNIRQIIVDSNISEFEEVYRYLYDHVEEYAKGNEGQIIIKIEEYLYHANFRIDKEINIAAFINQIIEIIK